MGSLVCMFFVEPVDQQAECRVSVPDHDALADDVDRAFDAEADLSDVEFRDSCKGAPPQIVGRAADRDAFPNCEPAAARRVRHQCFLRVAGFGLALLAGFLTGVNALPFDVWRHAHPTEAKGLFVFAQALGVYIASTAVLLVCMGGRQLLGKPALQLPVVGPPFMSGCIWTAGFVFMCW